MDFIEELVPNLSIRTIFFDIHVNYNANYARWYFTTPIQCYISWENQ